MGKIIFALSILLAASLTPALAGSFKQNETNACPGECQKQMDELNSSQAQQNEIILNNGKMLNNHENRLAGLEKSTFSPWYIRTGVALSLVTSQTIDCGYGCKPDWDTDLGYAGTIALGREIGNFRAELEWRYNSSDLEDHSDTSNQTWVRRYGDISISTVMLNGYYRIPIYEALSIYGVTGIGYAKYDIDLKASTNGTPPEPIPDSSSNSFAYKLGAGLAYDINDHWEVDLGYEYLGIADNNIAESIDGHSVVISALFKF